VIVPLDHDLSAVLLHDLAADHLAVGEAKGIIALPGPGGTRTGGKQDDRENPGVTHGNLLTRK
jgi:hypothetical protein